MTVRLNDIFCFCRSFIYTMCAGKKDVRCHPAKFYANASLGGLEPSSFAYLIIINLKY